MALTTFGGNFGWSGNSYFGGGPIYSGRAANEFMPAQGNIYLVDSAFSVENLFGAPDGFTVRAPSQFWSMTGTTWRIEDGGWKVGVG